MRIAKDRTFFWRHEGSDRIRVEVGGKIDFMAFDVTSGVGNFRFEGITSSARRRFGSGCSSTRNGA